jgi:hypothetical protein
MCMVTSATMSATLIRSPSSYNHTYKHIYCLHVYVLYIIIFLLFLPDIRLPNALLLLDTRSLDLSMNQLSILTAGIFANLTSLQWVCVSRGCLQSTVLEWKCSSVYECVYVWVYMTVVWPNIKCLLHMDHACAHLSSSTSSQGLCEFALHVRVCKKEKERDKHTCRTSVLYIQASGHTDVHVQTDRQTQWMDSRNSSSTHTRTCSACSHTLEMRFTNVYESICFLFVCPLLCRSIRLGHNQLSALSPGILAGLSSLRWVCVFLVAVYGVLCLSESVGCVWECVRMSVYDSRLT